MKETGLELSWRAIGTAMLLLFASAAIAQSGKPKPVTAEKNNPARRSVSHFSGFNDLRNRSV